MKRMAVLGIALFFSNFVFCQTAPVTTTMTKDFSDLATEAAGHTGSRGSGGSYQTYTSTNVDGNQFFLTGWGKGQIITNNSAVYSDGLLFAYDKVRQEIFIKQNDSVIVGNKDDIKYLSLNDGAKQYHFANSSIYTQSIPKVYYELLVDDSAKISFLKLTQSSLVKADKTDMMKQAQGNVYDAFVDKTFYYLVKGRSEPRPVQLRYKSVKKIFTDLGINPDKYMAAHTESVDEEYLINMVTELNK